MPGASLPGTGADPAPHAPGAASPDAHTARPSIRPSCPSAECVPQPTGPQHPRPWGHHQRHLLLFQRRGGQDPQSPKKGLRVPDSPPGAEPPPAATALAPQSRTGPESWGRTPRAGGITPCSPHPLPGPGTGSKLTVLRYPGYPSYPVPAPGMESGTDGTGTRLWAGPECRGGFQAAPGSAHESCPLRHVAAGRVRHGIAGTERGGSRPARHPPPRPSQRSANPACGSRSRRATPGSRGIATGRGFVAIAGSGKWDRNAPERPWGHLCSPPALGQEFAGPRATRGSNLGLNGLAPPALISHPCEVRHLRQLQIARNYPEEAELLETETPEDQSEPKHLLQTGDRPPQKEAAGSPLPRVHGRRPSPVPRDGRTGDVPEPSRFGLRWSR
ncbi:basic proline-rich protein-like [Caloenas nicobarica]|uniref:basic proline-rich protein-like n=1 Tax=Caloenas nicobarica TaxID=187106 RepID=UPI0032B6FB66